MQVAEQHVLYDPICVIENKLKLIALGKEEHKEPERTKSQILGLGLFWKPTPSTFLLMVFALTVLSASNTPSSHNNILILINISVNLLIACSPLSLSLSPMSSS